MRNSQKINVVSLQFILAEQRRKEDLQKTSYGILNVPFTEAEAAKILGISSRQLKRALKRKLLQETLIHPQRFDGKLRNIGFLDIVCSHWLDFPEIRDLAWIEKNKLIAAICDEITLTFDTHNCDWGYLSEDAKGNVFEHLIDFVAGDHDAKSISAQEALRDEAEILTEKFLQGWLWIHARANRLLYKTGNSNSSESNPPIFGGHVSRA